MPCLFKPGLGAAVQVLLGLDALRRHAVSVQTRELSIAPLDYEFPGICDHSWFILSPLSP